MANLQRVRFSAIHRRQIRDRIRDAVRPFEYADFSIGQIQIIASIIYGNISRNSAAGNIQLDLSWKMS